MSEGTKKPLEDKQIPLSNKVGYASGNLAKSLLWSASELFFLYFLTDILELPPQIAGAIFLICLVWDGITDFLMGYIIDSLRNKIKTYSRYLVIGSPLIAIMFVLSYLKLPLGTGYLAVYACIVGILFRTAYSIVDVPHNSMLANITSSSRERVTLSGLRLFFSSVGGLLVSIGIFSSLKGGDLETEARNFLHFALLAALIVLVILFYCSRSVRPYEKPLDHAGTASPSSEEIWRFFRANGQMWIVFGLTTACSMAITLFSKNIIYFSKYTLDQITLGGTALILLTLGKSLCQPLWVFLARTIGKKQSLQVSHFCLMVLLAVFYFTASLSPWLFFLYSFFIGCTIGGIYMLNWAILPDVIEYGQWKSGVRMEATVFGMFTLLNKVSIGVGVFILSVLLSLSGFEANSVQSEQASDAIVLLMCLLPALGCMISLLLLTRYTISAEAHNQMVKAIKIQET